MTETRQQVQQSNLSEEEVAFFVAYLLAGGDLPRGTSLIGAVAGLLRLLPGAPDADVTARVARRVVLNKPEAPRGAGAIGAARVSNLSHAGHYAVQATKRIVGKIAGGEGVAASLEGERRHLIQHLEANRRRLAGARMVDAAAELHGPLLGWKHGHPTESRPNHAAADGQNFVAAAVPASTEALPGVLPGCTCTITAPFEGAQTLS